MRKAPSASSARSGSGAPRAFSSDESSPSRKVNSRHEKLRGVVRALDRDPEQQPEQQQENRQPEHLRGQDAVHPPVAVGVAAGRPNAAFADALAFLDVLPRDAPREPAGACFHRRERVLDVLVAAPPFEQALFRHRFGRAVAALQQTDRREARVQLGRAGQVGREKHQRVLGLAVVAQDVGQGFVGGRGGQRDRLAQRLLELRDAPFPIGAHRDDGDAELLAQLRYVDVDALLCGLVHQVDAEEYAGRRFHDLERQADAALQGGRVGDDDGRVDALEGDEVARQLFLRAVAFHRAHAGQIDDAVFRAAVREASARHLHRLAGPVSCVLIQAGKRVEQRAFAHVGIARQRDGVNGARHSTIISLASSLRMATTAPRTR